MPIPAITLLPAAPTRADSASFDSRADALMTALPPFVEETNAAIDGINTAATAAETDSATAVAARDVAVAAKETAVAAGDMAVAARNETVAARDVAVAASDDAQASKTDAALSAEQAAASAASAAAVTGLPAFGAGDAGKVIAVSSGEDAFVLGSLKTVNGVPVSGDGDISIDRGIPLAEGGIVDGACDFSSGYIFTTTISADTTISLTNLPASGAVAVMLRLTNGGSATVTWPAGLKWPGGIAPSLTASGMDEVVLFRSSDGIWSGLVRKDVK